MNSEATYLGSLYFNCAYDKFIKTYIGLPQDLKVVFTNPYITDNTHEVKQKIVMDYKPK